MDIFALLYSFLVACDYTLGSPPPSPFQDNNRRACRGAMAEHCRVKHLLATAWLALLILARHSAAFCELESQESCMEKFVLQGRCPVEAGCLVNDKRRGCNAMKRACQQPQACYNSQPSPCSGLSEDTCSSAARCRWVVREASGGEDPGDDGKALCAECMGISAVCLAIVLVCFAVRCRQARQWRQAAISQAMEERRKPVIPECKEAYVVLQPCGDTAVAMEMASGIGQRAACGARSSEDETAPPAAEATGSAEFADIVIPPGSTMIT